MGLIFFAISLIRRFDSLSNGITLMNVTIKEQVTEDHVERFGRSSQYLAADRAVCRAWASELALT